MTDELIPLEIERELKCCRPDPVMKNVYITPKRHIHIGDGWRDDYLRAIQAGFRAYKITRHPKRSKYTKTRGLKPECREQYAKYQAVIDNHIPPDCNEYYRYGFEVIGLMLYGLCCWLHERFMAKGHGKVFFLARDGYIMQEGLNGSVGIVDIGWAGHIQKYLREYVSRSGMGAEIYGYYFGLKGKEITGHDAESFIPQELKPSYFCSLLLEYPFTKQAGSVKGYTRNNDGSISPVLEEYEFAGTEDEKIIGEIQRGALDFVSVMRDGYGYEHADYSVGYSKLRKVTKFPSLHDTNIFSGLHFMVEGKISEFATPSSILHYIIHPRDLKRDFIFCGWHDGFLKRLLKLPLPYDSILTFIREKA